MEVDIEVAVGAAAQGAFHDCGVGVGGPGVADGVGLGGEGEGDVGGFVGGVKDDYLGCMLVNADGL